MKNADEKSIPIYFPQPPFNILIKPVAFIRMRLALPLHQRFEIKTPLVKEAENRLSEIMDTQQSMGKKLEMKLVRIALRPDYTIGRLFLGDQQEKFCDTLEPTCRPFDIDPKRDSYSVQTVKVFMHKVKGKTAFPDGRYRVTLNPSCRFRRLLPRLQKVPGFDDILIHQGNTAKDTQGCILVGENTQRGMVLRSTVTLNALHSRLLNAIAEGKQIFITISTPKGAYPKPKKS